MRGSFKWSSKWWPGVIPLGILWAFALWVTTVPVEADLESHSRASLKNNILDRSRIVASGRDITFSAEAFSEEGRRSAVSSVEATPGVRLVNDHTRLVAEAKPFVWTAERDVVRVSLSGWVPHPAVKARLMEAAKAGLPGTEVVDKTELARGAPSRFEAAALLLVDQIARLKDGKISLSDNQVSLSGMARDLGGREAIAAALKNLPDGFTVTSNEVKAPPYIFQANKDPVTVTLTLSGYVPDNAVHAQLLDAVGRKFYNEKIQNKLKSSIGAPRGFSEAVPIALGALSRLSTGTLEVSDRQVKLSGDALYDAAAVQIRSGLAKDLPQGWTAKTEISVKPTAAPVDATVCQQLFAETLMKGSIRFETASATIDRDSASVLDRLIETALRCSTAHIEVIGHTDSDGDAAANQALSERRAEAVASYMVNAGIPADRFTTSGDGSTHPLTANDTEAGKAQNRRIEFVVR